MAHGSSSTGIKIPRSVLCIIGGVIEHGEYLLSNKNRRILGAIHLPALLMSRTGSF